MRAARQLLTKGRRMKTISTFRVNLLRLFYLVMVTGSD